MSTSLLMSKVMDISMARRRIARNEHVIALKDYEKRESYRRMSRERVFMQIVSSDDPELVSKTFSCETVDVSAHGLKLETRVEIPVGAHLDLWVDDSAGPGKFFLSCEVRWCRQAGDDWNIGVELFDSAATDIAEWRVLNG